MALSVVERISIGAPAARVWAAIRNFDGLQDWHPAVAASPADKANAEGSVRKLSLQGGGAVVLLGSVLGAIGSLRGNTPAAPTDTKCGIPVASGRLRGAIGRTVLGLEAACLRRGLRLPYGHTLFALAETGEHLDLTG